MGQRPCKTPARPGDAGVVSVLLALGAAVKRGQRVGVTTPALGRQSWPRREGGGGDDGLRRAPPSTQPPEAGRRPCTWPRGGAARRLVESRGGQYNGRGAPQAVASTLTSTLRVPTL